MSAGRGSLWQSLLKQLSCLKTVMLKKSPCHNCGKCSKCKAAYICWESHEESWHLGTLTHFRNSKSLLFDSIALKLTRTRCFRWTSKNSCWEIWDNLILKFVLLTFRSWFILFSIRFFSLSVCCLLHFFGKANSFALFEMLLLFLNHNSFKYSYSVWQGVLKANLRFQFSVIQLLWKFACAFSWEREEKSWSSYSLVEIICSFIMSFLFYSPLEKICFSNPYLVQVILPCKSLSLWSLLEEEVIRIQYLKWWHVFYFHNSTVWFPKEIIWGSHILYRTLWSL